MNANQFSYLLYTLLLVKYVLLDVFVNFVEAARQFVFNIQYRSRWKVLICAKHVYLEERQKIGVFLVFSVSVLLSKFNILKALHFMEFHWNRPWGPMPQAKPYQPAMLFF